MTNKEKMKKLEEGYIKRMRKDCFSGDTEIDHSEADDLLRELLVDLGMDSLIEVYDEVDKWFS